MSKTKIEWCDYTINPVKGLCPMACPYCYARRMYKRFKWNPEISYEVNVFDETLNSWPRGSKVFLGSTIDLFHEKTIQYLPDIIKAVKFYDHLTFIFLTKQPKNLAEFSPFPGNAWVGVSTTSAMDCITRLPAMAKVEARVKFVSFEPLLKPIASPNQLYMMLKLSGISWVIIGQQTPVKASTSPNVEWVREIVQAADNVGVPVFLKDNLDSLLRLKKNDGMIETGLCDNYGHSLRQEFPVERLT